MFNLGYSDGMADAVEDAKFLSKKRLHEVAQSLNTNKLFSESYVAGYQTKVGKLK